MSTKNKSRLEVQNILREATLEGMKALGLDRYEVSEFANASLQKADRIVLLNYIRSTRVGWQGRKYINTKTGSLERVEEWIDEQRWQFHSIAKRNAATKAGDMLAEDMACMLITWFNGPGAEYLIKQGVAPLRIDTENIIVYNDNSDLYQKRAVFTMKLQVPKEVTLNQPDMVVEGIDIHRV